MKARYIIISLAFMSIFCACNREEESLFDQSAADRLNATLTNAEEVLAGAPNGWEMLYFANKESGGYSVLLKFDANGHVFAASRNPATTKNVYKTDNNSTWVIRADYGPILSFDTYNNVMHAWADPQSDGDGLLGDYEFLILEATPEHVRLKGKKHSAYVELYPMPEGLNWEEYFNQVYEYRDLIVTKNDGAQFKYSGIDGDVTMTYKNGIMIHRISEGEENLYPFVVRPNCLTFQGPGIPAQGGQAMNFRINDTRTAVDCIDLGMTAQFTPALSIVEILNTKLNNYVQWTFNKNDMGSTSLDAYNDLADAIKKSKGTLRQITMQRVDSTRIEQPDLDSDPDTIDYKVDRVNFEYKGTNGITQAFFNMDFKMEGTLLTYEYKYPSGNLPDATQFINRAGGATLGVQRIKNLLTGSFEVTSASGSALNVQAIYLTDPNDSNRRLKIVAK